MPCWVWCTIGPTRAACLSGHAQERRRSKLRRSHPRRPQSEIRLVCILVCVLLVCILVCQLYSKQGGGLVVFANEDEQGIRGRFALHVGRSVTLSRAELGHKEAGLYA